MKASPALLALTLALGTSPGTGAEQAPDDPLLQLLGLDESYTGDLPELVGRGRIRILTTYSHTQLFVEDGRPRGVVYEAFTEFGDLLNRKLGRVNDPVQIVFIPVAPDRLIPELLAGRGDVVAGNLSVVPSRQEQVDFSEPLITGVRELLVTAPGSEPIASLDDLSGRTVYVRAGTSYRESLDALSERLRAAGREPVDVRDADGNLHDEDLLQMVAGGLYPATLSDSHLLDLWREALPDLQVHEDLPLREDASVAWALRKGSPALKAELDAFAKTHRKGTLYGNVLMKRYFRSTRFVKRALEGHEQAKLVNLLHHFQTYGAQYDLDWLLLAAQGFQESGLDQSKRSPVGAIGVMQLMPTTAAPPPVSIPNIDELEPNVHAGTKYMRILVDRYFDDPALSPLDRHLLALAAYNAGPTRVSRLRTQARDLGYDSNRWFGNVELVVGSKVGREPVVYVGNIYKYYVAYRRTLDESRQRKAVEQRISGGHEEEKR